MFEPLLPFLSLFIKIRSIPVPISSRGDAYAGRATLSEDARYLAVSYGYKAKDIHTEVYYSPTPLTRGCNHTKRLVLPRNTVNLAAFGPCDDADEQVKAKHQELVMPSDGLHGVDVYHLEEDNIKLVDHLDVQDACCFAYSPTGLLAVGTHNGGIFLFGKDEEDHYFQAPIFNHTQASLLRIASLAFSSNNERLFITYVDGTVTQVRFEWQFLERKPRNVEFIEFPFENNWECAKVACHTGAFHPCVFAGYEGDLKIIDADQEFSISMMTGQRKYIQHMEFHRHWQMLTVVGDKSAELIHAPSHMRVKEVLRFENTRFLTAKFIGRTFLLVYAEKDVIGGPNEKPLA